MGFKADQKTERGGMLQGEAPRSKGLKDNAEYTLGGQD